MAGRNPQAPDQPSFTPAAPPPLTIPDPTGVLDSWSPASLGRSPPSLTGTELRAAVSGALSWSPANRRAEDIRRPGGHRKCAGSGVVPLPLQRGSPGYWENKGVKKDGVCS